MKTPLATSTSASTGAPSLIRRLGSLQERASAHALPFFLLALRVLFGYALFLTGKGKLGNLDAVTQFFTGLGIPAAAQSAAVVGIVEMFGGLLLIAGLASRAVAVLLAVVLAVALATAHSGELAAMFSDPGSFIGAAPTPYLVAVIAIALVGAGRFSLDHLLGRRMQ